MGEQQLKGMKSFYYEIKGEDGAYFSGTLQAVDFVFACNIAIRVYLNKYSNQTIEKLRVTLVKELEDEE